MIKDETSTCICVVNSFHMAILYLEYYIFIIIHRIRGGLPILKKGGSVKFPEVTVDYLIFKLLQDEYFIF